MYVYCTTKCIIMLKANAVRIRLSNEAMEAYRYLQQCKMRPAQLLRSGGETALMAAAAIRRKRERRIPNAPEWLYDD